MKLAAKATRLTGTLWFLPLLALLFTTPAASACNVPVFRYALEKWHAGKYEVFVFHDAKLTAEQEGALKLLQDAAVADPLRVNIKVEVIDLKAEPAKELVQLYQSLKTKLMPVVTVLYPVATRIDTPVWTGPLLPDEAKKLMDSPARAKIGAEILKGNSAVWVMLRSGNKAKDDKAAQLVTEELLKLEKTLKLPVLTDDPEDKLTNKDVPLKLKFSVVQLERDDPAEGAFVEMLLNSEKDEEGIPALRTLTEPMVFPVFGRGRGMYALVGAGINEDNLFDAAKFLIGPCTCKVKEQNPGFDLLMNVDWDSFLGDKVVKDFELPPLVGITKIKPPPLAQTKLPPLALFVKHLEGVPVNTVEHPVNTNVATNPDNSAPKAGAEPMHSETPTPPTKSGGWDSQKNVDGAPSIGAHPTGKIPTAEAKPKVQDDTSLTTNTLIAVGVGMGVVAGVYLLTRARSSRGGPR